MKKTIALGLCLVLAAPIASAVDWLYYRDHKPFISPIRYPGKIVIRNDEYGEGHFGARRRGGRSHRGVDMLAPLKSDVMASKGGRVTVGYQKDGMGKYVILRHPEGYKTLYGHLSEILAEDDERVRQGDLIGLIGKTGNARYRKIKPHLHFEIKKDGRYLDPLSFVQ